MPTDPAGVERSEPLYTVVNTDKKRVAYFYDSDIGNYAYVTGHPMKPHRIRLAHSLVMNYDIYKFMEIYRAKPAVFAEMTQFHTDEYIDFLQKVTPDNMDNFMREQGKYNVGDDCPVFDGLFEFCGISAGGSMEGAARLNRKKCDIAINWAGGLHHAKKSEASGFCYVNDIVLAIIELLRFNKRVLYIDIDVHHGDGVEEAFYTTDRVMTVSFHKYGEYFPGTGELRDIGIGPGKHYAVNFPLRDGIDDRSYETIFEPVIEAVMKYYQPEAVVLQCGGDSLSGDRLGCFNLSMRGHANCVKFVRSFNLPTLVLGGGGYTMRNVARTWAYETGRLVGVEMNSTLPYNEYYDYYGPDYELDVRPSNMENANSTEYLEKIKVAVIENLKKTAPVPSVQMQDVPRQGLGLSDEEEAALDDMDEDENKDVRMTQRQWEKKVERQEEYEESDDEDTARANGVRKPNGQTRKSILDYKNPHADVEMDSGMMTPVRNGNDAAEEAHDADETMVDEPVPAPEPQPEASAPEAPEREREAEAEPAESAEPPEENKADEDKADEGETQADKPEEAVPPTKTDEDGDVDMAEATEAPQEAPIKKEEVEPVPSPAAEREKTPVVETAAPTEAGDDAKPAEDKKSSAGTPPPAATDGDATTAAENAPEPAVSAPDAMDTDPPEGDKNEPSTAKGDSA
ncbi:hypothetical protein VTK73DRAFT_8069 [Phialemonium thermophilum]|uniref:histone deacetylase n=1 Tax=Phialemonium thermophilum TaxID=223376 RepID=A0ABR3XQ49_9PEZI